MAANYFLFFLIFGVTLPYLSPVLLWLGFRKDQIGLLLGAVYFFNTVIPVLGGRISDRFLRADQLLRLCSFGMVLAAVCLWVLPANPSFWFVFVLLAFAACRAPVVALQDTLAMQEARADPQAFTRMRSLGSLGFVVAVTLSGYVLGRGGKQLFFPLLCSAAILFFGHGFFLPREKKPAISSQPPVFWRSLDRSWWWWLTAMMCHWLCFGPYHYGFTLFLEEEGVPASLAGWFWSIGVVAEIGVFLFSGWFFKRGSYRRLLFVAFGANLLRWCLLALYPEPWLIAFSQLLHGLGFGLFYAAAIQGIQHYCGGVNRASYQGLFSTFVGGFSSIIGSILAGRLHMSHPFRDVILWFVPIQVLALLILYLNPLKIDSDQQAEPNSDP